MNSKDKSLKLLQKLVGLKARDKRGSECLKKPNRVLEDKDEWFICVPSCFNDCLDIAKTERVKEPEKVWTQGSRFAFHRGCILYDTSNAYHRWDIAINKIKYCVLIHDGKSVEPATNEKERNSGKVIFSVLSPCPKTKDLKEIGEFELSQDEFVRFLICGNSDIISI
ncbi:MAG: hypothetical protein JW715_15465 [Sedimentisphaerales bacterium]|nr:hypothetical protein [Sedimentisphaerales bacterium]